MKHFTVSGVGYIYERIGYIHSLGLSVFKRSNDYFQSFHVNSYESDSK